MTVRFERITDQEFERLTGACTMAFSSRIRAATVALNIRDRIATVAADLRRLIVAGEVTDPARVAAIAGDFDHLAREVELEVGRTDPDRWTNDPFERLLLQRGEIHEYEVEIWHAPQETRRTPQENLVGSRAA